MRYRLIFILLAVLTLVSCKDEPENPGLPDLEGSRVLILNEGNFQWGNASLSVYDPSGKTITNKAFYLKNNRPLGDVAQSVTYSNGSYFLVVNNSGTILRLDTADLGLSAEWKGFTSPRYMYHYDDKTAYVTDLYARGVFIVDKTSGAIRKKLPVNGWTDRMVRDGNDLLVTNRDGAAIYRIDLTNETIRDSIVTDIQPNQMVLDVSGRLWVLCSGKPGAVSGSILVIDTETGKQIRKFTLGVQAFVNHLDIDATGENIFYITGDLYKMHYTDTVMPSQPLIDLKLKTPYCLRINHHNGEIYLSDAHDFLQASTVYRYAPSGQILDEFKAGIISGDVLFEP